VVNEIPIAGRDIPTYNTVGVLEYWSVESKSGKGSKSTLKIANQPDPPVQVTGVVIHKILIIRE